MVSIRNSLIKSVGYGIYCNPLFNQAITVRVTHSHVQGSYKAFGNGEYSTLLIGSCIIEGGIEKTGGTLSCFGNFDENMNAVNCPP